MQFLQFAGAETECSWEGIGRDGLESAWGAGWTCMPIRPKFAFRILTRSARHIGGHGTWSFPVGVAVVSIGRGEGRWTVRPSGVIAPRPPARPVAVDLFCGVGGFSLGFIRAGFHVVAGLDNDPFAAITYMHNLGAYPCQFHFASEEDGQRLEKAMRQGMERSAKQHSGISHAFLSGHGFRRHFPELPGVEHFFFGMPGNSLERRYSRP